MRTTNFDKIASAAPVNRQAAVMREGGGDHYEARVEPWHDHWHAPPPPEGTPSADLPRLEGRTFGDGMRVVRFHGSRSDGARWLVRCPCGSYELRRSRVIRTAVADHVCQACDWTRRLELRRKSPVDAAAGDLFRIKLTEAELRWLTELVSQTRTTPLNAPARTGALEKLQRRMTGLKHG